MLWKRNECLELQRGQVILVKKNNRKYIKNVIGYGRKKPYKE